MKRPLMLAVAGTVMVLSTAAFAHQGHTTAEPWEACDASELDDACAWQDEAHATYRGTCRLVGDDLMCVRNQPIEHAEDAHLELDE